MTYLDDLEEIEGRASAATRGPWSEPTDITFAPDSDEWFCIIDHTGRAPTIAAAMSGSNAKFISKARADVPRLVRFARALICEIKKVDDEAIQQLWDES